MPLDTVILASLAETLTGIVLVLFFISALLLSIVILMQEGKGGGLSGAFGGAGTETFGVKAGAVNKFTAWLGGAFLVLALLHAGLVSAGGISIDEDTPAPNTGAFGPEAGDPDAKPEEDPGEEPNKGPDGNAGNAPGSGDDGSDDGNAEPGEDTGDGDENPDDEDK